MIAWSGFLLVVSQGDSGKRTEARKILTNTVVGIVIALAGWLIVDAIMVALYNPDTPIAGGKLGVWSQLVTSGGAPLCIPSRGESQAGRSADGRCGRASTRARSHYGFRLQKSVKLPGVCCYERET